jgi:hypothetical protein
VSLTIPTELLAQVCTVEVLQGTTGAGEAVYGAPVAVACRFEATARTTRDPAGQTVTRYGPLFLPPDTALAVGDRVTVAGQPYTAAAVEALRGLDGPTHLEADLEPVR